ncbi:hypothetical protein [Caballeronia sp. AZ7_KS35]|uniref:hypothetical protein n=1 Tax=Caballeronia sp. AZ7_KS35 TaxID=2921762 RepID=UPI0020284837|nr:hypothetical protein [Caballeronia sp. AZ7_KS35]
MNGQQQAPEKRQAWSRNGEDYTCDDLHELIDLEDDLEAGDVVFVGEVKAIEMKHLCDADDVIEMMGERAYDEAGEWADNYPDVTPEAKAELDALLLAWMEKHAKPSFYTVVNAHEYTVTAEDLEGRTA